MQSHDTSMRAPKWVRVSLWVVAVIMMLAAAIYQRLTGPTHKLRGQFDVAGQIHSFKLIRSAYSTHDTLVSIPDPGAGASGTLHFKRYPTNDEFTNVPLQRVDGSLGARLPAQPAAGKLEYFITLDYGTETVRIPDSADANVIIRFKDPTPLFVLLPHVLLMFFAVLVGMRAALAAIADPSGMRKLAWTALVLMTLGGMILGPLVQKFAFGAYWTGFPFGYDLTDNKTLLMWIVWVVACAVIGVRPRRSEVGGRVAVVLAATVMTVVYLIPHSLRGSELDYGQLDEGVPPAEAVEVGR